MPKALHIKKTDNVAICTSAVAAGDTVEILEPDGTRGSIRAVSDIAFCNKIALCEIAEGEDIVKYGEIIGRATADIPKGALANDLNIASQPRNYAEEYILGQGD